LGLTEKLPFFTLPSEANNRRVAADRHSESEMDEMGANPSSLPLRNASLPAASLIFRYRSASHRNKLAIPNTQRAHCPAKSDQRDALFDAHFQRGSIGTGHISRAQTGNRCRAKSPRLILLPERLPDGLKNLVPNAKIVCTFRHPVERILSLVSGKTSIRHNPVEFRGGHSA